MSEKFIPAAAGQTVIDIWCRCAQIYTDRPQHRPTADDVVMQKHAVLYWRHADGKGPSPVIFDNSTEESLNTEHRRCHRYFLEPDGHLFHPEFGITENDSVPVQRLLLEAQKFWDAFFDHRIIPEPVIVVPLNQCTPRGVAAWQKSRKEEMEAIFGR